MAVAAYRIEVNGRDLTDTWRRERRLLSIEVADRLGAAADACTLELDDRAPHVAWPPAGAQIRLWLGPSEAELRDLGTYTLDVPQASGPPHLLTVTGHAENFVPGRSLPMHSVRSRLWQNVSLADMAETIAADHGLTAKVARALEAVSVPSVEQIDEADLAFLERIAKRAGGRVRVRSGQLEVLPTGPLSSRPIALGLRDLESWYAPLGERLKPGRVIARWSAPKSGRAGEVVVGQGEPVLVLGELFEDREAAQNAAESARDDATREAAQLALALTSLRTDIGAGAALEVNGLRAELDGAWTAVEIVHRADGSAGRTAITAQRESSIL